MNRQPIQILLIEDIPEDAQEIQRVLAEEHDPTFRVEWVDRVSAGLQRLAQGGVDLVLLDLFLPDIVGLEGLVEICTQAQTVPIVVLTAADNELLAVQALQQGAQDYLVKGIIQVYPKLLTRSIRYAIERKRSEEQVRAAHSQTEQLLAFLPSILIGVNTNGIITHWNAVAESTFGLQASQTLTRPLFQCGIPWEAAVIQPSVDAARTRRQLLRLDDVPFTYPDGRAGMLGITIIPITGPGEERAGLVIFGADITERKQAEAERLRLQEELSQAQKMETIGRFAGGIAHDFQNVLQVILGFAWLLRSRAQQTAPELGGDIEEIIRAAESATGMIRQLLAFSRRQALRPTVLEINQTIRDTERRLQQLVGERIRLQLELADEPLLIKFDTTALEQILINLCSNARDAMAQGGVLTIRTTKEHEAVRLFIQDTGGGMDPDVAGHIFEPFFTTKPQGKGTGLGLAVVHGLVKQHGGRIDVQTNLGEGTTFHLSFPSQALSQATSEPVEPEAQVASAVAPAPPGLRRSAASAKPRILIVDDEAPIRQLCLRILQDDYVVAAAASGEDALEQLAQGSFELLLTDIKMPGLDGMALIERAAKLQPLLRVVTMSAFLTPEMEDRLRAAPLPCEVIRKPFSAEALQEKISDCVGRR